MWWNVLLTTQTLKLLPKNVGPLTKETTKLFGNNDDNVPTRTAVDNFVDKKLALTQ